VRVYVVNSCVLYTIRLIYVDIVRCALEVVLLNGFVSKCDGCVDD
jgi:hypothetical protein